MANVTVRRQLFGCGREQSHTGSPERGYKPGIPPPKASGSGKETEPFEGSDFALPSKLRKELEGELEPELEVAGAARTDERIAGSDIGRGASAAQQAVGAASQVDALPYASLRSPRIGDERVIEHIEELDTELGGDALLELEVFE